jgi:hypothetical protein
MSDDTHPSRGWAHAPDEDDRDDIDSDKLRERADQITPINRYEQGIVDTLRVVADKLDGGDHE